MTHTVFFSWQSDSPNECGRSFVERALEDALKLMDEETTLEPAIREEGLAVDQDTKGTPGTPPIVETIFKKIDRAACFLADLTFVGTRLDGKARTPNPNVLVEYGWALKSLSHSRVVAVMNTAYGEPSNENLPFDMRHLRRPIAFFLPAGSDADTKKKERTRLTKDLKRAIEQVLTSNEFRASLPSPPASASFVGKEPLEGSARFRLKDAPLGVLDVAMNFLPGYGQEVKLMEGPAIWLRVMPTQAQDRVWPVSELRRYVGSDTIAMRPLGGDLFSGHNFLRAEDGTGLVSILTDAAATPAISVVFTTGEIWSVNAYILSASPDIPFVESWFADAFQGFVSFLQSKLHVPGPYRWIAGVGGAQGRYLQRNTPGEQAYISPRAGPCLSTDIIEQGTDATSEPIHLALRAFFFRIYDSCGVERPSRLDGLLATRAVQR
jgi:hypothetical protein